LSEISATRRLSCVTSTPMREIDARNHRTHFGRVAMEDVAARPGTG
jgi:hypothetical protein